MLQPSATIEAISQNAYCNYSFAASGFASIQKNFKSCNSDSASPVQISDSPLAMRVSAS
jgi:hypothetical protein